MLLLAPPAALCLSRGIISSGRRFEMVFEYTPSTDEPAEAFWQFSIPEQNIEVPFLLVGLVAEPRVFFDRPNINFGQVGPERSTAVGSAGNAMWRFQRMQTAVLLLSYTLQTGQITNAALEIPGPHNLRRHIRHWPDSPPTSPPSPRSLLPPPQVLVGGKAKATITLVNHEHLPFQFSLDKASYDATDELVASMGQQPAVTFEPSAGAVAPHSSVQLLATFTPR